jgi:hypothetical protein
MAVRTTYRRSAVKALTAFGFSFYTIAALVSPDIAAPPPLGILPLILLTACFIFVFIFSLVTTALVERTAPLFPGSVPIQIAWFLLQTVGLYAVGLGIRFLLAWDLPIAARTAVFLPLSLTGVFLIGRTGWLFLSWAGLLKRDTGKEFYPLLDREAFSSRAGGVLGLVGVRFIPTEEVTRLHGASGSAFVRKQILFLLTHNSRQYEPWGRAKDKSVCLSALVVGSKVELDLALERIRSLLEKHDYFPNHGIRPTIELRFAARLLPPLPADPDTEPEPGTDSALLIRAEIERLIVSIGGTP